MEKPKRYPTVYFNCGGYELEAFIIERRGGWLTLRMPFTDNIYKRRTTQVWHTPKIKVFGPWPLPACC